MQHPMTISANQHQVFQLSYHTFGQFVKRCQMVTLNEAIPDLSICLEEIKRAQFAFKFAV